MIRFLTVSEVVALHDALLAQYGGEPGLVGGTDLLESAVAAPRAAVASGCLHEDAAAMAAAYLYHIVLDHPFLDGNKRTGCAAAMTFLKINGYTPRVSAEKLRDVALDVQGKRLTKASLTAVLRQLSA